MENDDDDFRQHRPEQRRWYVIRPGQHNEAIRRLRELHDWLGYRQEDARKVGDTDYVGVIASFREAVLYALENGLPKVDN